MSFLEDLVGSFAKAGAETLGDVTAQNAREREMDKQNQLAIERARVLEEMRADMEDKRAAAKQKRISDQTAEIEAATPAVTLARQVGEAQSRAPSVDANVLDAIKAKLTPAQLKQFYGVDTGPVSTIDDQLKVARQKGFYDAEAGLRAARAETVKALSEQFKQQMDERKTSALETNAEANSKKADAAATSAQAAATRAEKYQPGGGSSSKTSAAVEKLNTQKSNTLREIQLLQESTKKSEWDKNPELTDARARLKQINKLLSDKWEKDVQGEDAPAAKPTAPTGMTAIGKTPDGRIVYKTADGKQVVGK